MSFHSYGFLLLFLPAALTFYFSANRINGRLGQPLLLLFSLIFICLNGVFHGAVALLSTVCNFGFYRGIQKNATALAGKAFLAAGLIFNIAVLCFFKYANLFGAALSFPLGISFYTFQQIAFLVDARRGCAAGVSLMDYSLFTLFFPKAVQGPIPYAGELLPQLHDASRKEFCSDRFAAGLFLFAIGLSKKVLLADNFGIIADYGYGNISALNSYEALLTILAYTFQLYFDFSGYSDMAVGIGYMFNIELPVNFDSPYKAKNISDFWKRWHITLTRFLTKYIYYPLGGNRKGVLRTFLNIFIVYLISGLWHGTGITFLLWGVLHALASVLYRIFKKPYDRLPSFVRWAIQFAFINISWVFFRARTLPDALRLLNRLWAGGWRFQIHPELTESLLQPTVISVLSRLLSPDYAIVLCFCFTLLLVLFTKNSGDRVKNFRANRGSWLMTYVLLVLSILSFSGVSSFLYSNF